MKDKISIIFIPTLLAFLGLLTIYTFLHWMLFIKLEVIGLKEVITNFGIPITLTGLTVVIFLRPRLKILSLETARGNLLDIYSLILWIVFTVPLIIAQEYIVTASGKLTTLNSIAEINTTESTKFYTVKNYYVFKKAISTHTAVDVTGKGTENFNMHIYVVLPILEKEADTISFTCSTWLGIEFKETIDNSLDQPEKDRRYLEFVERSEREFDSMDVSKFTYLDKIRNSDKREGFVTAIKNNIFSNDAKTILVPVHDSFEARNGRKLSWIIGSSLVGLTIWLFMILIRKIDYDQLRRIKANKPDEEAQAEIKEALDLLKPTQGYFVTPILICVNLGIYILMAFLGLGFISFSGPDLVSWGANYGPLTTGGDWWRLVTSTFLHGGIMHVLANMYGLIFIGIFLEPILGKFKFLTTYLLTGILGSIASIWWYDATVSVGASGAIFGLYGLFLSFWLTKVFPREVSAGFAVSTVIFVAFNLLMGLTGGIDNAAHIGGLLSGFIIGLVLYPTIKIRHDPERAELEGPL
ncbi:rhomboid family intramembrane serine protease [Pseudochryseolinea flava]|uniref:Rhomboid family intramembrane serine protease n=1 Tax=Pseudochryseolinea flava TaxID=2059302 RepID=A0A364XYU2_9BACT|nr:rhomboid family intramembrane serine protease [Pseudochryseolinea flava]RAV98963.1 rhomboid family intramembrane serine protease [Pseudochryseolinea flava]